MSKVTGLGLPADYARWQERLVTEFFGGRRGQPVVMFVDRDELQQISDDGEDGPRSLASAVQELVEIERGASMFVPVCGHRRCGAVGHGWNHRQRCPFSR